MAMLRARYPEGPLLRSPADLDVDDLAAEEVAHISSARVVLAEYDVLQQDFPELRTDNLASMNPQLLQLGLVEREDVVRSIIDEWLLANAAFVSTAQAAHAVVNTPIDTDGNRVVAYRPPNYGRAVVVPIQNAHRPGANGPWRWALSAGMLDLKGAGVAPHRVPANGYRSSGLEYLGIALSDFLMKRAIDEIFARTLPTAWTVPVYAVLDLGFDVRDGYHGTGPAGMHVRRSHRRPVLRQEPGPGQEPGSGQDRTVEKRATFDIESVLRRYGITAATLGCQLHIASENGRVSWQTGRNPPSYVRNPEVVGLSLVLLNKAGPMTIDRRDVQLARGVSWPPACAQMVDFGHLRVEPRFDYPTMRSFSGLSVEEILWPDSPGFVQPDPALRLPLDTWKRANLAAWCFKLAGQFRNGEISRHELGRQVEGPLHDLVDRWSHERAITHV